MRPRDQRKTNSRSDYEVGVAKRKAFPPRSGISPALDVEKAIVGSDEIETLQLRIRTLTATNTNLRRRLKGLTAQLKVAESGGSSRDVSDTGAKTI